VFGWRGTDYGRDDIVSRDDLITGTDNVSLGLVVRQRERRTSTQASHELHQQPTVKHREFSFCIIRVLLLLSKCFGHYHLPSMQQALMQRY